MQKVKKEPILLILSVLAIFVLLIVSLPSASDRAEEKVELMPLNDGWYYMKDGINPEESVVPKKSGKRIRRDRFCL